MSRCSSNFIHPSFHHHSWAWLGPWRWDLRSQQNVQKLSRAFFCFGLHPRQLTWEWQKTTKNHRLKMYPPVSKKWWCSIVIFVFSGCFSLRKWTKKTTKKTSQSNKIPKPFAPQLFSRSPTGTTIASPGHPLPTYIVQGSPGSPSWWHFWHKRSENVDEFSTHHQQTWKSSPCTNWTRCFVEYALQII